MKVRTLDTNRTVCGFCVLNSVLPLVSVFLIFAMIFLSVPGTKTHLINERQQVSHVLKNP